MHNHVFFEAGDGLDGLLQTDPVAFGLIQGLDSLSVCLFDLLLESRLKSGEHTAELCIHRGLPCQMDGLGALILDALSKGLDTNIYYSRFLLEHLVFHCCASCQETISPASSAALALLGWRITPYSSRRLAWSATS